MGIKLICCSLIIAVLAPAVLAGDNTFLITTESWTEHVVLNGSPNRPVVISPLSRLDLSDRTESSLSSPRT
ncbi:hypothetical protein ACFL4J_01450 [Candidatus Margulisiibacteriota bacterium]